VLQNAGPLREELHYTMDWELWCRFLKHGARWAFTDKTLGVYRVTGDNKSFVGGNKILREMEQIYREYASKHASLTHWFRHVWLPLTLHGRRNPGGLTGRAANFFAMNLLRILRLFYPASRCEELQGQYWVYGVEQEEQLRAAAKK
jgi:hypothetical protein